MGVPPGAFGAELLNNADAEQQQGPTLKQAALATVMTGGAYAVVKAGGAAERATHPEGLNASEATHMQQDMAEWAAANGINPQRLSQAGVTTDLQAQATTLAPQGEDYHKNPNPPAPRRPGGMG